VAERELARVTPVVRDVLLRKLDAGRGLPACEPRSVPVVRIFRRRVRALGQRGAIASVERAEAVVVAVVLLDDDHDVLDRAWIRARMQRRAWFDHSSWTVYTPSFFVCHAQMSPV